MISGWVDSFKTSIIERFLKGYVVDYLKRQKGFVMFGGIIYTLIQVAAAMAVDPQAVSVIGTILNAFKDTFTGVLQPNEITIVATSLVALYGAFAKALKAAKGLPQVPTIVVDKEVVKEVAPELLKK